MVEPYLSQTYDVKVYICHFLTRRLALLESDKDWLVQCQDNVIEWDI